MSSELSEKVVCGRACLIMTCISNARAGILRDDGMMDWLQEEGILYVPVRFHPHGILQALAKNVQHPRSSPSALVLLLVQPEGMPN